MPTPPAPAIWARVSSLFDTARELPSAELAPWLEQAERAQPELVPWLRDMLQAHASRQTDDWLERGPELRRDGAAMELAPGTLVGPWRLLEPLGSGGMATVWRASPANNHNSREVALKLPMTGRAGLLLVERFAREQHILARLEHPHIARLYEAGVDLDGTPWLAMECVAGRPLTAWCNQQRLGLPARLALFAQVLDAVQYAHARLVIHRDIKPSNILVDAQGQVHLLDFGIAKMLDEVHPVDGATVKDLTQVAGRMMTLAYAAPEQVRGEPLTTAADLYSLGVVLFELLVGCLPYRLPSAAPGQLEGAVASADTQRASAAVTEALAAARRCTAPALRRALRGDLDTVLAKALAADPAARYASAAAFAEDLARYATGQPIAARRARAGYRLRKWVGCHRLQAAAAAAVLASVACGSALALWQARVATEERNVARAEAERSSAINFFFGDLLEEAARSSQPINGEQLVVRAEVLARSEFKDNPDALAAVFLSIGTLHESQGRRAEARRVLQEAHGLARDVAFRDDIACDLAALLDDAPRAIAMLSAVADADRTSARGRAACLVYLGDLLRPDDAALAQQRYLQALKEWERTPSRSPHDRITILGRLAFAAALQGRISEALRGYDEAVALSDALGREGSAMGTALRNRQARTWLIAGAPGRALPMLERLLADHHQRQGNQSPPQDLLINQGQALIDLGRAAEALAPLQAAAAGAHDGGNTGREQQARCLLRWALALQSAPVAHQALARTQTTNLPATPPAARADPLARASCLLAQAQALSARWQWAALDALLTPALGQHWPEPQWPVDALLLRAKARLQDNRVGQGRADAQAALVRARQLQDGAPDGERSQAALALLAQSRSDAAVRSSATEAASRR